MHAAGTGSAAFLAVPACYTITKVFSRGDFGGDPSSERGLPGRFRRLPPLALTMSKIKSRRAADGEVASVD
eukprot:scaffold75350_cov59-Phaeocystis_antarctica.AAC.2